MECYIDYIGIDACGSTTSDSGLYINQLPGITFQMIDDIMDPEDETFLKLWKKIQERALRRFKKDYKRKFASKYVGFCYSCNNCDPEDIACDEIDLFADAWMNLLAIELMTERIYSSRLNRYTTIDKDQAVELRDFFSVEYEKTLNAALCMIPQDTINRCFERTSAFQKVESLP